MKTWLSLILALLCASAAACGGANGGESSATDSESNVGESSVKTFSLTVVDNPDLINKPAETEYAAGEEIVLYAHPIMDCSLAMYVNGEFYALETAVRTEEGYVWEYRFFMPEQDVVVEFRGWDIEYIPLKEILDIPDISVSDVKKVRIEQGYIGVAPGSLVHIQYSMDFEDIQKTLSVSDMVAYREFGDRWQVDGGGYTEYSVFTKDGEYTIRIANGYLVVNGQPYCFCGEYVSFEYPYEYEHVYSFVTYLDTFTAYTAEGAEIGERDGLAAYEFVEYYPQTDLGASIGYLQTEFGKITVYADDIFSREISGSVHYYAVFGEKKFSDIFA